jgi:hypothetical protein
VFTGDYRHYQHLLAAVDDCSLTFNELLVVRPVDQQRSNLRPYGFVSLLRREY